MIHVFELTVFLCIIASIFLILHLGVLPLIKACRNRLRKKRRRNEK